jgi:hypothetical protein
MPCNMGVGCDEYGVCYAEVHGQPERCERPEKNYFEEGANAFTAYMEQPDPHSTLQDNPYPWGTVEANQWDTGWEDAYQYFRFGD